ncbi:MAG TPA: phosphoribosyltransferase family protein, partial [bacterium]|nr:phosphoribosyltransferase family protein [bacterium]
MQERKVDILVSEEEIKRRIGEIAAAVDRDFAGDDLVVVGVLKGSFIFMADLVRRIRMPLTCDFLRVSSYSGDVSTGAVRMEFDMTQPVFGKSVRNSIQRGYLNG